MKFEMYDLRLIWVGRSQGAGYRGSVSILSLFFIAWLFVFFEFRSACAESGFKLWLETYLVLVIWFLLFGSYYHSILPICFVYALMNNAPRFLYGGI